MEEIYKLLYERYDEDTLEALAYKAIKDKDYEVLKSISKAHQYNKFIGLRNIEKHLDLEAVKVVLNNTKFSDPQIKKIYISNYKPGFSGYYFGNACNFTYKDQKKEIINYVLEWQISKEVQLTYEHLGVLMNKVSYFSAFEFYQQHIDNFKLGESYFNEVYKYEYDYDYRYYQPTKVSMLSDLSFMYNEVKEDPKSFIQEQKCLNDEFGPLLSRTYSKILSIYDVQRIYHDIYFSGKIGKAIISYINENIVKGDDIVIDFAKGGYSSFNIDKNNITISLSRNFITIEATVAHEIAHYIIQSVFKYYAMPDNVCKSFNDKESKLQYVGDWQHLKSKDSYNLLGFKEHKCFNPKISTFMKAYDDATKDILFKVADILKMSNQVEEYKEYVATDLASHLATSSVVLSLLTLDDSIAIESHHML